MNTSKYLRISDFAKIAQINVRTLHYYDEIGLLSPEMKNDKGYRFYSLAQVIELSIILSLKELDVPLSRIKSILASDADASLGLIENKIVEIDKKVHTLGQIKTTLSRKVESMKLGANDFMNVRIKQLGDEQFILSHSLDNTNEETLLAEADAVLANSPNNTFANNEYGVMIRKSKKLKNHRSNNYDYFYLHSFSDKSNYTKQAGTYLSILYKGDEKDIDTAYKKLISYSTENAIELDGYFYEKAIHETVRSNKKESISEIQIKIKETYL